LWAFRIARFVPAPLFLRAGIIYRLLRRSLYTRCLMAFGAFRTRRLATFRNERPSSLCFISVFARLTSLYFLFVGMFSIT
jgi:hypothetical protein